MTSEASFDAKHLPSTGMVPIRTVSSLTGVNPVTLRAWERRYGLIKPVRTPKGHRLYTLEDVKLINHIIELLEGGMSIGQVSNVIETTAADQEAGSHEEIPDPWSDYQRRLIEAVSRFDENTLNDIYNETLSLYPVDIVTSRLIVPLLEELGWRWETAQGSIAEEHFFSVFLRNKLGARLHHRMREVQGPTLVASCMPGEQHEVGILLFALAAVDRDYRVILLGANTPLTELPKVVERAQCQAIVLSGSAQIESKTIEAALPQLLTQVTVPVFVGGKVTTRYANELTGTGVISLGEDITFAMRRLDHLLSKR